MRRAAKSLFILSSCTSKKIKENCLNRWETIKKKFKTNEKKRWIQFNFFWWVWKNEFQRFIFISSFIVLINCSFFNNFSSFFLSTFEQQHIQCSFNRERKKEYKIQFNHHHRHPFWNWNLLENHRIFFS